MRSRTFGTFVALSALPSVAKASDPSGLASFLYCGVVLLPWGILNALALVSFAYHGRYASERFAKRHSIVASVVPAFGMLVAVLDLGFGGRTLHEQFVFYAIFFVAFLMSGLPMLVHRFTRHD